MAGCAEDAGEGSQRGDKDDAVPSQRELYRQRSVPGPPRVTKSPGRVTGVDVMTDNAVIARQRINVSARALPIQRAAASVMRENFS